MIDKLPSHYCTCQIYVKVYHNSKWYKLWLYVRFKIRSCVITFLTCFRVAAMPSAARVSAPPRRRASKNRDVFTPYRYLVLFLYFLASKAPFFILFYFLTLFYNGDFETPRSRATGGGGRRVPVSGALEVTHLTITIFVYRFFTLKR